MDEVRPVEARRRARVCQNRSDRYGTLTFGGVFTLTYSCHGNLLMLWAVRFFFLAGALLVLQSIWAFADGIRFLG